MFYVAMHYLLKLLKFFRSELAFCLHALPEHQGEPFQFRFVNLLSCSSLLIWEDKSKEVLYFWNFFYENLPWVARIMKRN